MSQMRDLPPIAGAIIWARQIERQLITYMKCIEDVLRKGWELYAEGQKLQSESTTFWKKLDTCPVYDAWLHGINQWNMGVDGWLFEVVQLHGGNLQHFLYSTYFAISHSQRRYSLHHCKPNMYSVPIVI
jgi:hypothetical protein